MVGYVGSQSLQLSPCHALLLLGCTGGVGVNKKQDSWLPLRTTVEPSGGEHLLPWLSALLPGVVTFLQGL